MSIVVAPGGRDGRVLARTESDRSAHIKFHFGGRWISERSNCFALWMEDTARNSGDWLKRTRNTAYYPWNPHLFAQRRGKDENSENRWVRKMQPNVLVELSMSFCSFCHCCHLISSDNKANNGAIKSQKANRRKDSPVDGWMGGWREVLQAGHTYSATLYEIWQLHVFAWNVIFCSKISQKGYWGK